MPAWTSAQFDLIAMAIDDMARDVDGSRQTIGDLFDDSITARARALRAMARHVRSLKLTTNQWLSMRAAVRIQRRAERGEALQWLSERRGSLEFATAEDGGLALV